MEILKCLYRVYFHVFTLSTLFITVVYPVPTTITSCPADHYAVLADHGDVIVSCQLCRRCPPGYGVVEPCTATHNAVCQLCPIGTFSSEMARTETCQPCRSCGDARIRQVCSPIADAVCDKACPLGKYYDQTAEECRLCSYCFPDRPNARTLRIRACQTQGLPDDFQCSPLPARSDDVDDWPSSLLSATRDRSVPQSDIDVPHTERSALPSGRRLTHDDGADRNLATRQLSDVTSDGNGRTGNHRTKSEREQRQKDWRGADDATRSRTHGDDLVDPMSLSLRDSEQGDPMSAILDITHSEGSYFKLIEGRDYLGKKPTSPPRGSTTAPASDELSDVERVLDAADSDENNNEKNIQHEQVDSESNQDQSQQNYRTLSSADIGIPSANIGQSSGNIRLTSADIGLVVGIALGCGVLSFLVTALACHCCLVRRGKSLGPKIAVAASGKAPVNAWTYVDIMPTAQPSTTIETPTTSRKISCV